MSLAQLQIQLTPVATGFTRPTHIADPKDNSDRIFVVEQAGKIRLIQTGSLQATPFLDISSRVSSTGEQGLLSMAFPPDYASKGYFYVNYTNLQGDTVIARYRLSSTNQADPNSEQILLTIDQPFANHNGGQLAFGPDGYLYVGMGDGGGGGDPDNNAQNPNSLLGKILRIDVESGATTYAIPSDNPFRSPTDGVRDEIWASGLRNPWRFSFDRLTGDLYIADVGQNNFEEIDFQAANSPGGENYGWRRFEGNLPYLAGNGGKTGLTFPVAGYDHTEGVSVTGGFVYRGSQSGLQGVYLYGDFANGKIWGLQREGNTWKTRLLLDTDFSISSFGEDNAGNVYIADYGGGVYRISLSTPIATGLETGSAGNDVLTGNADKNTLRGLAGNDQISGLGRGDLLVGGEGNDTLLGGLGVDTLRGGQGKDILYGGNRGDLLYGGNQRDIFVLETKPGVDRIQDFSAAIDRLGLTSGLTFQALEFVQKGADTLIRSDDNVLARLKDLQSSQLSSSNFVTL